jgi:hypothetical protein
MDVFVDPFCCCQESPTLFSISIGLIGRQELPLYDEAFGWI